MTTGEFVDLVFKMRTAQKKNFHILMSVRQSLRIMKQKKSLKKSMS